jgi:type III restriction enzyme
MKLQFDPNQTFQIAAIDAVTNLFDGQPESPPEFSIIKMAEDTELFAGQERSELGLGNSLLLDEVKLCANTRVIQARNDIEIADEAAPLEGWELFDGAANAARLCPHFSVEMETGYGQDVCLSAHRLRAVATLWLQEVHHRRAERCHSRRDSKEHRDYGGPFSRSL